MTAAALLAGLRDRGVSVQVEGGNLRPRPALVIPAGMLAELRVHKVVPVAVLPGPVNGSPPAKADDPLAYLGHDLGCRVTLRGDMVRIGPKHRCPPPVARPRWWWRKS